MINVFIPLQRRLVPECLPFMRGFDRNRRPSFAQGLPDLNNSFIMKFSLVGGKGTGRFRGIPVGWDIRLNNIQNPFSSIAFESL